MLSMDIRAVEELRVLAEQDAELSGQSEALSRLQGEVAAVRERASTIDAFFAGYPAAADRIGAIVAAAGNELAARRAEAAEAEALLDKARDDDARAAARRVLARAADHVEVAEGRLARAVA